MKCPKCNSENTMCMDSRPRCNNTRARRYECTNCLTRFSTIEIYKEKYDKQAKLAEAAAELVKVGGGYE